MSERQVRIEDTNTVTLEIVARLIGALAFLTGLVYLWGLMDPVMFRETDTTWQIVMLVLGSLSLLLAWRWEMIGGLAALLCGIVLAALISVSTSYNPIISAFVYGSPFFIAGLLFLIDAYRHNRGEMMKVKH